MASQLMGDELCRTEYICLTLSTTYSKCIFIVQLTAGFYPCSVQGQERCQHYFHRF